LKIPELTHNKGFGCLDLVIQSIEIHELTEKIYILIFQDLLRAKETQANEFLTPDLIVRL